MEGYICDACGRKSKKKIKSHGYVLCNKHYKQFKKYGRFLDNNPRTIYDPNEIHVCGDVAYVDLYDKNCNVIAKAIIDTEDIPKVKYIKWKLSNSGYAMNTPKYKGLSKHMSRVILGVDDFVDHINHNKLDNRKCNLRVVTKSQNAMNSNSAGVSVQENGKFCAYIKRDGKRFNLGTYVFIEEALYARWYAEKILFGEYAYPKEEPFILEQRKEDIKSYVDRKVQRL